MHTLIGCDISTEFPKMLIVYYDTKLQIHKLFHCNNIKKYWVKSENWVKSHGVRLNIEIHHRISEICFKMKVQIRWQKFVSHIPIL